MLGALDSAEPCWLGAVLLGNFGDVTVCHVRID